MRNTRITILITLLLLISTAIFAVLGLQGERYAISGMEYYQRGDYRAAIRDFLAANAAADGSRPEYLFWLGKLNIAVSDTSQALGWFDKYLKTDDPQNKQETLDYIRILNRQDSIFDRISWRGMPSYLNSRNSDYGSLLSQDGKYLWFTSLAPTRFDKENIWRAEKLATGWGRPYPVDELNTDKNEAIGSFSTDGNTAYIFGNYKRNQVDGDIFYSTFAGTWQEPIAIDAVNSIQVEAHPMVWRDSLMFFSSSRDGGYGEFDIYLSVKEDGVWGEPINLGPQINTPGSEQTPFLDADGRTLFFSSNSHPGFGGYDVFRAVRVGKGWQNWSDPDNLGIPVNTIRNDRHFFRVENSNEAQVSSDRKADGFEKMYALNLTFTIPASYILTDPATGEKTVVTVGADGDIILSPTGEVVAVVTDTGEIVAPTEVETVPEVPVVVAPEFFPIFGRIADENNAPLVADLEFIATIDGKTFKEVATTDSNGLFSITLPMAESYHVVVNKEGYMLQAKDITIPQDGSAVLFNLTLVKLEVKKVFVFQNILFDFDKATIKKESLAIVDEIVVTMLSNPELKIEISGHTCNIGTDEYNLELSENRAKSVLEYLVSKGIAESSLSSKGYGESQPLNGNETSNERKQNRRVEVKVKE
ncbi:MAG: OmpA family protein [Candidatus Cloacimonas sp.]|nr:OmpA family protein [Candidatus Cloacimonas sp.]